MESLVVAESTNKNSTGSVDRKKTCPILLRVFVSTDRHNPIADYMRGKTPSDELQIYTWIDASLKELSRMIQAVHPESRRKGTSFQFAIVYADPQSRNYRSREIGSSTPGVTSPDDHVTLAGKRFQIGDFIDVAIRSQPFDEDDDEFGRRDGRGFGARRGFGRGRGFRGGMNRPRPY